MNTSDSRIIRKRLCQLNEEKQFERFDRFLIKKTLEKEYKKSVKYEKISEEKLQKLRC